MFLAHRLLRSTSLRVVTRQLRQCELLAHGVNLRMNEPLRKAKVWISAAYWLMFMSWRDALVCRGLLQRSRCVVLLYHGVQKDQRRQFESQMRVLLRMARPVNLQFVGKSAKQPSASVGAVHPSSALEVAVTFDDGFVSVAENAVEVLRRLNIPAVIFMPVASMGKTPGWWAGSDADEKIMSEEQVRALPADLISVASHSVTHPHLPEVNGNTLKWEMVHSRERLEAITGRPVLFFSYPYGEWSSREERAAREAGYEETFTIEPIPSLLGSHAPVGRVCVEPGDGPIEFRLKLLGAYQWMPWASSIKRALKTLAAFPFGRKELALR